MKPLARLGKRPNAQVLVRILSRRADSNCRPAVYETAALPAELRRRVFANDFGTSLTTKRGLRKLPLHWLTLLRLFSLDKSTTLPSQVGVRSGEFFAASGRHACKMIGIWKHLTNPGFLRASLVVLLLAGAYFASHPWTTCAFAMGPRWEPTLVRICSFGTGDPVFDRTGPGPLWPYPLFAAIYLFDALAVAFTRRIGFGAATRT